MSVSIDGSGSLIGIDQGLNIVGLTTLTGGIILDDSISHIGDTNTKIRFPAADTVTVETAGSERLRIDNVGWLGLNQTTKDFAGQVAAFKNTNNAHSWLSVNVNNNTGIGGIVFGDSDSWNPAYIQYDHTNNYMQFISNGAERLRITSAGQMLLGTTTEGQVSADDFTVAGSGDSGITIRSGSSSEGSIMFSDATSGSGEYEGWINYNHHSNFMRFFTNATERLRIASNGRIGVNRTTPSYMLDIIGNSSTGANCIRIVDGAETGHGSHPAKIVAGGTYYHEMQMHSRRFTVHTYNGSNIVERFRVHHDGTVTTGGLSSTPGTVAAGSFVQAAANAGFFSNGIDGKFGTSSNHPLYFQTNGVTKATITAAGAFSVGTTSPQQPNLASIHVHSTANDDCRIAITTPNKPDGRIGYFGLSNKFGVDMYNGFEIRDVGASYATRFAIDSSGRVTLNGASTNWAWGGADDLVLGNITSGTRTGITLVSGSNTDGGLYFSDGTSSSNAYLQGQIVYNHSSQDFAFYTSVAKRISIKTNHGSGNAFGPILYGEPGVGLYIDGATANMEADATATFTKKNNNDWALMCRNYEGASTDYGFYSRTKGSANYAIGVFDADNSVWRFRVNGGGSIYATNTTVSSISDQRLKENIVDANSQWDDIKALRFRNFNWKEESGYSDGKTYLGLIAQEVEPISPNLIEINAQTKEDLENGVTDPEYKNVKYSIVWMKAVKALQEAQSRIETLEAEVAALKGS